MKKLNGLQKAVANIFRLPTVVNPVSNPVMRSLGFNNGVTIYPYGKDSTFIEKGYNKNAWVYSIVSKCAKKFGQVPWYHYKIKTTERKTWSDYLTLTKESLPDTKARIEAKKMRKKAIDQVIVTSKLQDFLNKPNRNQPRAKFMENLYGYKLLTGEGNIWTPAMTENQPPPEGVIIPKEILALVRGSSPWDIAKYKLLFPGAQIEQEKELIISWSFPNYNFDSMTLSHLRGQSPLDAGLLLMQSSNEGAERLIAMNKNQGVAGAVFDKAKRDYPTPTQAQFIRQQFNEIVNDKDLAGQIAWLTGDLGYIQFGLDAGQLKLLEQSDVQFKGLCNIFDVPWQLFGNSDSYENRKQYKRDFIYDNISVAAYSLRDELNAKLIPLFNLDRDRDVIDADILSLPELGEDLKDQATALEKVQGLTIDQRLEYFGFDAIGGDKGAMILVPSGFQTLDDLAQPVGGNLDGELQMLNQNQ